MSSRMDIEQMGKKHMSTKMDEEMTSSHPEKNPEEIMDIEHSISSSPPKLNKALSIRTNSLIERLFFGSMVTQMVVEGNIVIAEEAMFGPILLDPTTNYFYKSWENYFYNQVEEFRGQKAAKWDLVRRFPEILCFQIQRAGYNVEKKCAVKNNQRFEFDQQIFVDRFLLENREIINGLRNKSEALEKERFNIESELNEISNFKDNRDIIKSLDDVLSLVTKLNSDGDSQIEVPFSSLKSRIENCGQISQTLTIMRDNLEEEKRKLSDRRQSIETEVSTLYSSVEKTKYVLFSIIIHEGGADSGHFYCFVRMQDKWFKFNDFYVREVNELEVMETAFGYQGSVANAYCVFYMSEKMWKNCPPHNFAQIGESTEGYYSFVNNDMLFNTLNSNLTFNKEVYSNIIKKINAEYVRKHDQIVREFDGRYKDLQGKVVGMRSICDFFIRMILFTQTSQTKM